MNNFNVVISIGNLKLRIIDYAWHLLRELDLDIDFILKYRLDGMVDTSGLMSWLYSKGYISENSTVCIYKEWDHSSVDFNGNPDIRLLPVDFIQFQYIDQNLNPISEPKYGYLDCNSLYRQDPDTMFNTFFSESNADYIVTSSGDKFRVRNGELIDPIKITGDYKPTPQIPQQNPNMQQSGINVSLSRDGKITANGTVKVGPFSFNLNI